MNEAAPLNHAARRALKRNKCRVGSRAFRCPAGHEEVVTVVIATKGGRERVVEVEQPCGECGKPMRMLVEG